MTASNQRILPIKEWYEANLKNANKNTSPHSIQIITPNQRLTRYLHQTWGHLKTSDQSTAWLRPNIFPIHLWLETHWNRYQQLIKHSTPEDLPACPYLLTKAQSTHLWQQIIQSDNYLEDTLLNPTEVAETAQNTEQLMRSYNLNASHLGEHPAFETERFSKWLARYQKTCADNNWLSNSDLPEFLWQHYFSLSLSGITHIGLYGFQEMLPYIIKFLNQIKTLDIQVERLQLSQLNQQTSRLRSFNTERDEIEAALAWAKKTLVKQPLAKQAAANQKVSKTPNRAKKIAIIVPNLSARRSEIQEISARSFNENYPFFLEDNQHAYQVNISVSQKLSLYPIIRQSLNLLHFGIDRLDETQLMNILISPFWQCSTSLSTRMKLRSILLKKRSRTLSLTHWQSTFKKWGHKIPEFDAYVEFQKTHKLKQGKPYKEWVTILFDFYALLGWPGANSLNSENYQLWQVFSKTIEALPQQLPPSYSKPDVITSDMINFEQAIAKLKHICDHTEFQAQSLSDQVQILGSLEAAGLPFDAVWMTGMDDQQWPPRAKANPFIPIHTQRAHQLPHASAQREIAFTLTYFNEMKKSAPHIVFSHAVNRDARTLQLSPLVQPLIQTSTITSDAEPRATSPDFTDTFITSGLNFETITNDPGTPFDSDHLLPGGVSHFKEANLCLFRAYARYRLKLSQEATATPGLTPLERGNIIHAILEAFWRQAKNHSALEQLDSPQMHSDLRAIADQSLNKILAEEKFLLPKAYINQEIDRLTDLALDWLTHENKRLPFRVRDIEKRLELEVESLRISARIDRIDILQDEAVILIDYKTGNVSASQWNTQKLQDPQLPIYLCYGEPKAVAIAFGQVKPEACQLIWQGKEDLKFFDDQKKPRAKNFDWQYTREQWKARIQSLAQEIASGATVANPLEGLKTCNTCKYSGLCRIKKTELSH